MIKNTNSNKIFGQKIIKNDTDIDKISVKFTLIFIYRNRLCEPF